MTHKVTLANCVRALLLCGVCTTAAQANDLEFWGGTKEGMSEREIRKLYPAATKPSDPERLVTGNLANNFHYSAIEGLRDCTVVYEGLPACGRFYFDKGKLVGMDVDLRDLDRAQPAATAALAAQLRIKLNRTLGVDPMCQEFKATESRGPASDCEWRVGPERVRLWYHHGMLPAFSDSDKVTISVAYRRNQ
jgi:hypothetical protein